ncbi:hypothetical protein HY572_03725 [Candidatus Micrarchaeota archaeon]|nr:hypothetical protein [Candidatus Micrarchaeota archaeon]
MEEFLRELQQLVTPDPILPSIQPRGHFPTFESWNQERQRILDEQLNETRRVHASSSDKKVAATHPRIKTWLIITQALGKPTVQQSFNGLLKPGKNMQDLKELFEKHRTTIEAQGIHVTIYYRETSIDKKKPGEKQGHVHVAVQYSTNKEPELGRSFHRAWPRKSLPH